LIEPYVLAAILVAGFTAVGVLPTRKFFQLLEARFEMQAQSTSLLRSLRGWSFIGIWAVLTWYAGSFTGDWAKTGDLDGALERAGERAEIILQIVVIIMEADS
jgi:hypothetical protein